MKYLDGVYGDTPASLLTIYKSFELIYIYKKLKILKNWTRELVQFMLHSFFLL